MTVEINHSLNGIPERSDNDLQVEWEYISGEMIQGYCGDLYTRSNSPTSSYYVVFDDKQPETSYCEAGGWFYAGLEGKKSPILDAMRIYPTIKGATDSCKKYQLEIVWSKDGMKAGLLVYRQFHAVFDFETFKGYCRTGEAKTGNSRFKIDHRWSDNALKPFVKNPELIRVPEEGQSTKEKQKEFIKKYLKPTLKRWGYQTSGNRWWKDRGDFFTVICLHNSLYNYAGCVSFWFGIDKKLREHLEDPASKKVTFRFWPDNTGRLFLSKERQLHKFRDNRYINMDENTDLEEFIAEMKIDFEQDILPALEKLQTLSDWVSFNEVRLSGRTNSG